MDINKTFMNLNIKKEYYQFLTSIEYGSYIVATLVIAYSTYLAAKSIYIYMQRKKGTEPIIEILRTRIAMGNLFILALTIIVGGHVIRFIYLANLKTTIFLIILMLVRELMRYFLEKELKDIYNNFGAIEVIQKKYF